VLSDIGGFTTQTALVLHLYRLTNHNAAYLGLMALATILPMVLAASNDLARVPRVLTI